jgi:hypothetical protein
VVDFLAINDGRYCATLPVAPIQCFHDKQIPSKAMFLQLRCSGSMRGRQTISCCSRSRCVYPLHRSPNHLRLQLQMSPQLEYSIFVCECSRPAWLQKDWNARLL